MAKPIKCPKCKSTNISFQIVEEGSKTKKRSPGLLGNTYNAARCVASIATLGIAGKILPKAEGTEKSKFQNDTYAVCQSCGNTWKP
jgi:predicted nucleic-acid-binding Zn-ribbon protein